MEELLMCSVCIERYSEKQRHPVLLPRCGHSFCRSCVAMLISGGCITCPTCRTDQRVESAEKLPTEYTLLAIIHAQEHTKKETCERHSVKLSFWCRTCEISTCGECLFEDHPTHSHDVIRALKYIADMKIAAQEVAVKFMEVLDEREQIFYKTIFTSTKNISNALRHVNVLRKDMEDARELMKGIKEEESITAATSLSEAAKFLGLKWNIQDANFNRKQKEAQAAEPEKDEIDIAKEKARKEMEAERLREKAEDEALEAAAIAEIEAEEEEKRLKEKLKESKKLLRKSKTLSYIEMAKEAEKIKDGKGSKLKEIESKLNVIESNKKLIVELPEKKESKIELKIFDDKKQPEEPKTKEIPKPKEELKSTKEDLKSTIEELKSAKEELRLLKEELMAAKQELKSLPIEDVKSPNKEELKTTLKEEVKTPKEELKVPLKDEEKSSKEKLKGPLKDEEKSSKEELKVPLKDEEKSSKEELKVPLKDEEKSSKEELKVPLKDEEKSLNEKLKVQYKDDVKSPKEELKTSLKEETKAPKEDLKSPTIDGENEFMGEKSPDLAAVKPKGKLTFKKTTKKTDQSSLEEKTPTKIDVTQLPIIKENEIAERKLSETNDDHEYKAESLLDEDVKVSPTNEDGQEHKNEQVPNSEPPASTKVKDPFEDKFELQEKLTDCIQVPGFMICVETPDGRLAELEWGPQGLHVHCLQYTQVTYDILIKCTMLSALIPSKSPIVFLELSAGHTILGKVYIKLWGHLKRAHNFLSLCLGDQGTSYLNTKFLQVYNINGPGERMLGGDYEYNNGRGGRGLFDDMEWNGDYAMPMKAGMITAAGSGQASTNSLFLLCTQSDDSRNFSCPFGIVCEGLKVAKEAVQQTATKQVWISDCGVLIVPPKL